MTAIAVLSNYAPTRAGGGPDFASKYPQRYRAIIKAECRGSGIRKFCDVDFALRSGRVGTNTSYRGNLDSGKGIQQNATSGLIYPMCPKYRRIITDSAKTQKVEAA